MHKDEIGRVVGLPREVGGIPLDEVGATGWGLAQSTEVAVQYCDFELKGARVVIQGLEQLGNILPVSLPRRERSR